MNIVCMRFSVERNCPVVYNGQVCRSALQSSGNSVTSTPSVTTFPSHCAVSTSSLPFTPGPGTVPNPSLIVSVYADLEQRVLEERVQHLLQPFQLPAVPARCLAQMRRLLCNTYFPHWEQTSGVCAASCRHIENVSYMQQGCSADDSHNLCHQVLAGVVNKIISNIFDSRR